VQNQSAPGKSRSNERASKRVRQRSQPLLHHPPHHLTVLYLRSTTSRYIPRLLVYIQFYNPQHTTQSITCSRCRSYLSWASTSSTTQPSSVTLTSSRSPLSVWSLCRKVCSPDVADELMQMLICVIDLEWKLTYVGSATS
jgi:hypothetical protein